MLNSVRARRGWPWTPAHTIYAPNHRDGTVSVINGSTRTVTAIVPVGKDPEAVAVDPGTHTVYVANSGDGTLAVGGANKRHRFADIAALSCWSVCWCPIA